MALPKINAPTYQLVLPSTGESVNYRPYLVKEEKIIMMAAESNDQTQMVRAIKDVIRSCTDGAVDVNKITMFDLEYVFIQLRTKSVGESSTISVKCTECGSSNDVEVDLSKITVNVPKDSQKGVVKKLTDDISVLLRYPNVDAVIQATEKNSEMEIAFDLIASCIDTIYQGDESHDVAHASREELNDFIDSLNNQQFTEIQSFVETIPNSELDVSFKCLSCSHMNELNIGGLSNFFS